MGEGSTSSSGSGAASSHLKKQGEGVHLAQGCRVMEVQGGAGVEVKGAGGAW